MADGSPEEIQRSDSLLVQRFIKGDADAAMDIVPAKEANTP